MSIFTKSNRIADMTIDKEGKLAKRRGRPKKNHLEPQQSVSNIGDKALERERERTERVCRELLEGYTDDFSLKEDGEIDYKESSVASQWGLNRGKVSRIIGAIYGTKPPSDDRGQIANKELAKSQLVPLALAELVEILGSLAEREKSKKPLTQEDILRIVQSFIELAPEERARLGFKPGICNAIIQEITKIIELGNNSNYQKIDLLSFYERLLAKSRSYYPYLETASEDSFKNDLNNFDKNIEKLVKEILKEHKVDSTDELVAEFVSTVKSEKRKIEADCGLISFNKQDVLNDALIQLMVQIVVENELLNKKIPIYLNYYEIKKSRPLPLFVKDEEQENGVLNSSLPCLQEWDSGIERQHAYTVSLHFQVKLSANFKSKYKVLFPTHANFKVHEGKLSGQRLTFSLESSGTGGKVHHLTKLVNLSLLRDIPCLKDYFPIAHDVIFVTSAVIQQSTANPLAYHTLTTLCKKKYVEKAYKQGKTYDQVCSDQQAFYGNYCGCDLLECAAKSSLFSRLRAITKIGTDTTTYVTQFCNRAERENQLRKALSYLKSYPFSFFAMQSHLEETIFHEVLSGDSNRPVSILEAEIEYENFQKWSDVTCEAYLELIDVYLTEGLYKSAGILIKKIVSFIDFHEESEAIFNSTIRITFEICRAKYYSIVDLDEYRKENPHQNMSHPKLVRLALEHLDKAEKFLLERLKKYEAINEQTQSNFSPFFNLHARILFYRGKLNLFYIINQEQESVKDIKERHIKQLCLFEKARIFAAMDGDFELYSYYSAYQAITYIVTAFIAKQPQPEFSRSECLDWASRLIEHALICYSDVGNDSYQKIKEKSGLVTGNSAEKEIGVPKYGRYFIPGIPSIIEILQDDKKPFYFRTFLKEKIQKEKSDEEFIFLDMAALYVRPEKLKYFYAAHTPAIYLFGTYASIILFARGLDTLCNAGGNSEQDFFADIELASRMFTYAWVTAEDSCVYTHLAGESKENLRLERRFFNNDKNKTNNTPWEKYYKEFSDLYQKEISYIRDIYLHRVTEIADFGKIFAGVCKYLLIFYNDNNNDCPSKEDLKKDIKALMNTFHSHLNLQNSTNQPDYNSQQDKFNGHFNKAFDDVKKYMTEKLEESQYSPEKSCIKKERDEVVKTIFQFLFEQDA
ncbi:MAG: hypothetical protein KME64_30925 [Scytonematopsis contorta HA4267-MV1]|jgi:hypothetical protein|nr:hypothetical protein [Scytonematopsis contorta HA4267-MV1]